MEKQMVLSKGTIKPSSSTPPHLQNLNLSFIDQTAPPSYFRLIFFYESSHDHLLSRRPELSTKLKHSLSDVLIQFHPLAGRIIIENSCVDCNDAGVEYIETQVHSSISQVIENPNNAEDMGNYAPMDTVGWSSTKGLVPLAIQVNFFDCGGIAIGVSISHKIADAESLVSFMTAWAAKCRGEAEIIPQSCFDLASRFPPVHLSLFASKAQAPPEITKKIVTKRFVFDYEKIKALKEQADSQIKNPSKVESVVGFIWRSSMATLQNYETDKNKLYIALQAVNLRKRASPPLPEGYFGNAIGQAMVILSDEKQEEDEKRYPLLIAKMRKAVREVDSDYVKNMENGEEYLKQSSQLEDLWLNERNSLDVCMFSSWCRFPVYEVDYGWGKPLWVSTTAVPFRNMVLLMDTKSGDGIEVWLNMVQEDMAIIENNYQLLSS